MQKQQEIPKKYLFFLSLYGIFAFIVFTIVLFPKEDLIRNTLQQVSQQFDYAISAKKIRFRFPGYIELNEVSINDNNNVENSKLYFHIDSIKIRPKLNQLFLKKIGLFFKLHLYQGNLKGNLYFDLLHPKNIKDFFCKAQKIQLDKIKQSAELFKVNLTGNLSGEAKVKFTQGNLLKGVGDFNFYISPGKAQIMNFPSFSFQKIKGTGNIEQEKINIQSVRIHSNELQAQMTGDLHLDRNIIKSYLNAKVRLNFTKELQKKLGPLAGFLIGKNKEGIRLHIKGNLNNLSFMPI